MTDVSARVESGSDSLVSRIERHLALFLRTLQENGLLVAAPKQLDFLRSVELIAPTSEGELYWVALTTLTTSRADLEAFDTVFAQFFGGSQGSEVLEPPPEPEAEAEDQPAPGAGEADQSTCSDTADDQGLEASVADLRLGRTFARATARDRDLINRIARDLPDAIPKTRARRRRAGHRGRWVDLRRTYAQCRRTYGEVVTLHWKHRPTLQRRVLIMIDVSGSMKQQSADYLRFAHVAARVCQRAEVFTFGTQLSRVTDALRTPDSDTALATLSAIVLDVDGGTRIGDSLAEFLSHPRFVTMARGAVIIIVSDGLERGDCRQMAQSVARLRLLGHRLHWWSPLACDPSYRPVTRGMAAARSHIDSISGVDDLETAHHHITQGLHDTGHRPAKDHQDD